MYLNDFEASAARAFYCDVLRGREVRPAARVAMRGSLRFLVAGALVEVSARRGRSMAPIVLQIRDPDALAERCWDAGFTVRVNPDSTGRAPVSVFDPFGRRVDLALRASKASARGMAPAAGTPVPNDYDNVA